MRYTSYLLVMCLLVLYFDFTPQSYLLRKNGEIYIDVFHKVPNSYMTNMRVRVVTSNGLSYLFNEVTNNWVNSSEYWSAQPVLTDKLKVKVLSSKSPLITHLEVLDLLSGMRYESAPKLLWLNTIKPNVQLFANK